MKTSFFILLLSIFQTAICQGELTNVSGAAHRDWGVPVAGVRLSVSLTNTIIHVESPFSVFAEMQNTSTNVVSLGESSPEQDFSVVLVNKFGRVYKLTPTPFRFSMRILLKLYPGKSLNWTIGVGCDHYFEPPGYILTKKAVPVGDYFLKASRKFTFANKIREIESNVLNVQIK